MRTTTTTSDPHATRTPARSTARYLALTALTALGLGAGGCGGDADAPDELATTAQNLVDTSPNGFAMQRWVGAWGSDGPIFTGDLNGDGKTDVFMWRDSDKSWTVNLSTGGGFAMQRWVGAWGSDGPIFTGDLNGDGKTDVFMWRDSDKSWTVNLSTGAGFVMQRWVGAWGSDGPIFTGDLNGDGKTDVFMWRDSDKSWTVNLSTGGGFAMQRWLGAWGSDGPIFTGDLNGDGRTDVFMWRDSDKSWTVNLSTGGGFAMQRWVGAWGSDGPIFTGDLNGDGKTDVYMWRGADSSWTVNLSTGGGFAMQRWLGACDSDGPAVRGDFNGDHRQDIMMWRDGFKQWMANLSLGGGFNRQTWTGAWGSDGPMFTGDLNGDGRTDVFMWRDADKSWTVNLSVPVALGPAATAPACGAPAWGSVGPFTLAGESSFLPCAGKVDDIQVSPDYDGLGHPAMYIAGQGSCDFLGFCGGGSGVWRSTDFTAVSPTWTPLTDHLPNLTDAQRFGINNILSVAVSPLNPRTVIAATNISPPALLRSADGGTSWALIAQGQVGPGGSTIQRVTVDPLGVIYVASTSGLYVSEDGGATFASIVTADVGSLVFTDVMWHSFGAGFAVFVAGVDYANRNAGSETGIYTIQKAGTGYTWSRNTWTLRNMLGAGFAGSIIQTIKLSSTPGGGAAASMTTADNNPGLLNIFQAAPSAAGGFDWQPVWSSQNTAFFTGGGYTLPVAIAPDGRAYGGGIGLGQSDGAGGVVNIQDPGGGFVAGKTIHVDSHVVTYVGTDQKIYVGTDGGMFRFAPKPNAPGVTAWDSLNTPSLSNVLSDYLAVSPANPNDLLVGHQDNGIARTGGTGWSSAGGNEGEKLFFDPNDPQGTTAYAWDASFSAFMKSVDGGHSFPIGLALSTPGDFELAFHPTQRDRFMVTAAAGPNRCTVLETTNGFAGRQDLNPPNAVGCPSAVAYAGAYRYAAVNGALYQGLDNGGGQVTWNITPVFQGPFKIVSVVADPANPGAVYFATSGFGAAGQVFAKANQADGVAWTIGNGGNLQEVTGNLAYQVLKLALIPSSGHKPALYVATYSGVFKASNPSGASTLWNRLGTGLPDVLISDLEINPTMHGVYVSLFGRGVWSLTDYSY